MWEDWGWGEERRQKGTTPAAVAAAKGTPAGVVTQRWQASSIACVARPLLLAGYPAAAPLSGIFTVAVAAAVIATTTGTMVHIFLTFHQQQQKWRVALHSAN